MTALYPTWTWGDVDLSEAPFGFGWGSDLGAPQTATEALAQLLTDGEIEVSTRASNRTLTFTVYVQSVDLLASAEAERLLALEAAKPRNTLTFDPGDGFAPATVFETFPAQMTFVRDDDAEISGLRRYDITMKASPSGLSADFVETPALPVVTVPTIVTIDAADATTGWSASQALADAGSYLVATSPTLFRVAASFISPAPVDLSSTKYVSLVMWNYAGSTRVVGTPRLTLEGAITTYMTLVGTSAVSAYQTRFYFEVPVSVTSATRFNFTLAEGGYGFAFNSLQRTDSVPPQGTGRQLQRVVAVEGSARTQGSLAVEHETSALGSTLIYTWPSETPTSYSPALRSYRVSGGSVTDDANLVSGHRDLLDSAVIFEVPVASLITGTHQLMARLRSDTASSQTVTYSAQLRQGSNNVGPATSGSTVVSFAGTPTAWRNVVLARLMLPTTDVPVGSTAVMRITIAAGSSGASDIDLDEAWIFNTSVGALSWVECGTAAPSAGGSSNRLWLDAATVALPRPTVFRGFSADRTDAAFPSTTELLSFGTHTFQPPMMNVFSVTSNALNAAVSLRHRPAWHTHAAK